jgi:hypothetical protein
MHAEASSEMALEKKKCVPCETGKLQPMSEEKAHSLLPEVVLPPSSHVIFFFSLFEIHAYEAPYLSTFF